MSPREDVTCESSGCETPAFARVSFANRLSEPEAMLAVHELSLCPKHIAEVKRHFQMVILEEIIGDKGEGKQKHTSARKHSA